MTAAPLRFCFGLHLHQPVGNFNHVFQQHLDEVYRPLLRALMQGEAWPVAVHLSGPLLDWLEQHAGDYLDELAGHVEAGRVELLTAGHDEPILAVLPEPDRLEQIARHREALLRHFGAEARGLWLTERVWEPDLPATLARAGVDFALVDDRHFLVSGFPRSGLHQHYLSESGGHPVGLFPIDERLRYLIPFRPAREFAAHVRERRAAGDVLAVMADDGEKFGGWPGTADWLYRQGWLEDFLATLRQLRDQGELQLTRFDQAWQDTPSAGLAYLPSASYHEMEEWSLPQQATRALVQIEEDWGRERLQGPEGSLLRGGHWRHFLVKYAESNRLHKTMLRLSRLCRERGDPLEVRRHIGRAQCNDAYWHGVFGGLYLPFLRSALWRELARAEALLRRGQPLQVEALDYDFDGERELLISSGEISALVAPQRGGSIEVLLDLVVGDNPADCLTRRPEAYHFPSYNRDESLGEKEGTASIHDLESSLNETPHFDPHTRALLVDGLVAPGTRLDHFIEGSQQWTRSWARARLAVEVEQQADQVTLVMRGEGLVKRLHFAEREIRVDWEWTDRPQDHWFVTELSLSEELSLSAPGATRWDYPVETLARSERGFDRSRQGQAVVLRWPASRGAAGMTIEKRG